MSQPSDKQLAFIQRLASERSLVDGDEYLIEAFRADDGRFPYTSKIASSLIAMLLQRDRKSEALSVTEPGVYEREGEVYIVKANRQKTRLYAKRLIEINGHRLTQDGEVVEIEFEYAPGAIRHLHPEDKMPLDRAEALTIRYGRCIVCGRHLKDAQSVKRGIGPVCIKSFGPVAVAA